MKEIKEGGVVDYKTPQGDIIEVEIKALWDIPDNKGHNMVYEKKYDTGGSLLSLGKQERIITPELNKEIQRGDIFKIETDFTLLYYMLVQTGFIKPEFRDEDNYNGGYYLISLQSGDRLSDTCFAVDSKRKDIIEYLNYGVYCGNAEYVDINLEEVLDNYIERRKK